jgi:hypothetical protein
MRREEEERCRTDGTIAELMTRKRSSEGSDSFVNVCHIRSIIQNLQKMLRRNNKGMQKLERKMSETVIFGSMEIWRQNGRKMEQGVRENVKKRNQEEVKIIQKVEVEVEIQTEIENHGEEFGDRREDHGEDEDFGPKEEQKEFEMELGRRLGVEAEAELNIERKAIIERKQG